MSDAEIPKKWWQGFPAVIGGITAFLIAIGGLFHEIASFDFGSLVGTSSHPEFEQVIDREYIVESAAHVWKSDDITAASIANLTLGASVLVRGKLKGKALYLIQFGSHDDVGYVVTDHLVEADEWRKRQERQGREQRQSLTMSSSPAQPVSLAPVPSSLSPADWIPDGTRIKPSWNFEVKVWQGPTTKSEQLTAIPPGKTLSRSLFDEGVAELLRKINGGEWYEIGSLGRTLGYVRGSEVEEVWPRQQPPASPVGKRVREKQTDKIKYELYDVDTHFDLYFSIVCPVLTCDSVSVYTGEPAKDKTRDTRLFESQPIIGLWQKDAVVKIYINLPRTVVETKGVSLFACIGTSASCYPSQLQLQE